MLGLAAPARRVLHQAMPVRAAPTSTSDQAKVLGRAIASLRERLGVSQEELADRLGIARQTVSRYETGRSAVLRLDIQRAIAAALEVTVDDIVNEGDNIIRPDFPGSGRVPAVVNVVAQPQIGADGEVRYRETLTLASEDLGWLFGPNAGFLQLADGALPDGAFNARLAGFDRSAWPRKGQGCVIETREGELIPGVYDHRSDAGVHVRGGSAAGDQVVPANTIKGVYAIRFWGD